MHMRYVFSISIDREATVASEAIYLAYAQYNGDATITGQIPSRDTPQLLYICVSFDTRILIGCKTLTFVESPPFSIGNATYNGAGKLSHIPYVNCFNTCF